MRRRFSLVGACLVAALALFGPSPVRAADAPRPRLIDLGSDQCIPCKKMLPVLEALQRDYAGVIDVIVIDVKKSKQAARGYRFRVIPTQLFIDVTGKEVFRHEGFFSREEIEKVFREKFSVAPRPPAGEAKP